MAGFGAAFAAFAERTATDLDQVTAGTVREAGARAVELSPVGDPTLWKKAPPASYRPGDFKGNWFYSQGAPSNVRHNGIGITEVNNLDALPPDAASYIHIVQNNLDYGPALDFGHSTQAPAGITAVLRHELSGIAYRQARNLR
jgi:hypothetical protein